MLTTLRASAHDLVGLADKSIHMIATSPPYYGLRAYAGDQAIEWPTVTFRLNEWTEPLTVQGCAPGCDHEWAAETSGGLMHENRNFKRGTQEAVAGSGPLVAVREQRAGTGRYCVKCHGWRGALGQEPTPVAYIGHLILCLREWHRVLRDDGTVFVNLGDTYAATTKGAGGSGGVSGGKKTILEGQNFGYRRMALNGLKAKDLIGIPWLFAIAARADGWYLRDPIIWAKMMQDEDGATEGQCMPGSQQDRTTTAHEYIFMLAKSPTYYYDGAAIRAASGAWPRSVWQINPQPYKAAHYAVWPERLVDQMIRAGSSEGGACPTCGAPWLRQTVTEKVPVAKKAGKGKGSRSAVQTGGVETSAMVSGMIGKVTTIGWRPSCICGAPDGWLPDDLEIIDSPRSPIGEGEGRDDPTPTKGRRGLGRTRAEDEGRRPMTRYEQRHYAAQLRASPHEAAMATEAGDAFAHYRRTGRGGGRPVPPTLLESWIERGWLTRVTVPDWTPPDPAPCRVLDPFTGSGTTARVAIKFGREAVASDLSGEYLAEHVPARTTVQMELQV